MTIQRFGSTRAPKWRIASPAVSSTETIAKNQTKTPVLSDIPELTRTHPTAQAQPCNPT